jgi:hypothetical protein
VLPYVAVVMANATSRRGDGFALLDEGLGRPELGSATGAVHTTPEPGKPGS